ncbi:MAG TPA: DoxX family membrane protein [Chthoniobacteraceae bacterium]|nr:DoxX family membrane protein [Chthoniobacteraceae bacterium]
MKIITLIARVLLGLGFTVFGANLIHPFLPMPQEKMPDLAQKYMEVMWMGSPYMLAVGIVQLVGGLLVLSGVFTPMGLTLLGPVLVNIMLYHTLIMKGGYSMPLPFVALWLIVFAGYWKSFEGILKPGKAI